jgi:hypothetical protein
VTFAIPFGLTPINLADNMFWNEAVRELTISLGSFAERESKIVAFTLEGEPGRYLLSGRVLGRWPATNLQPTETFQETISPFEITIGADEGVGLGDFFRELRNNPELVEFANNVSAPVSVVLGAGGAAAVVNSALTASAEFAAGISKFFSYLGLGFLRLRRRKPWGRVYNHLTGKPIEGAIVKVLDAQFKKVKETQITDSQGRFGFLVAPGEYYIKVSHRSFSEKETQIIKVLGPAQALNLEIALDPLQTELAPKSYKVLKVVHFFADALEKISPWILAIGAILSIFTAIIVPSVLSFVVVGLYAILIILKIALHFTFFKSFGWILDRGTDKPLPLSVVRIFNSDKNWLLATKVTDQDGRFNFLIGPGNYYVTAVKEGYKSFQSAPTHFTKHGLISYDIKLERQ